MRTTVTGRTIVIERAAGTIAVWQETDSPQLAVQIDLPRYDCLMEVVERVRRIFDLGADPVQIANHLELDPRLWPLLAQFPGLRVPGAWHGFELAVVAILGRNLSRGNSKRGGSITRLVKTFGKPIKTSILGLTHLFPHPHDLMDADLSSLGIPETRARTIRGLAYAVFKKKLTFQASKSLDETISRLVAIEGISRATAHYIAMRAFAEPDAFPAADSELGRILGARDTVALAAGIEQAAERWRPWRAYAVMHLCATHSEGQDQPGWNTSNREVR